MQETASTRVDRLIHRPKRRPIAWDELRRERLILQCVDYYLVHLSGQQDNDLKQKKTKKNYINQCVGFVDTVYLEPRNGDFYYCCGFAYSLSISRAAGHTLLEEGKLVGCHSRVALFMVVGTSSLF